MSTPQLISPLLDGFVMGDPISTHDGVCSCPAMHLETDKKYIVKIISLPANQSKLDALLLAGAFSDRESALAYFKELSDGVMEEAELLQKLARHEGFVSFDNWQQIPMDEGETGFDIYLLSQYRPTLENALRNNEMTHLQAINLGLDLCAALSVARRFGYLFCNLKPANVYICNEREFRIGDLGFLSLDSLQYASLPDKYHSEYTPAEISDAYSALNSTMDTYAVGLILYQAYNDGQMPTDVTIPPRHASQALAEIILKACATDPAQRWEDPVQMGQALVNYLQSNTVNDTPIVPPAPSEPVEIFPDEDTEPLTEDVLAEVDQALEAAPPIIPAAPKEEIQEEVAEEEQAEEFAEEPAEEVDVEETEEVTEEPIEEETPEVGENLSEESKTSEEETEPTEEISEEEAESAENEPQEDHEADEMAQMLAQAEDLIAHKLPDPPVAPDPIEVNLPEKEEVVPDDPEVADKEITQESEEEPKESAEVEAQEEEEVTEEYIEDIVEQKIVDPRKTRKRLLTAVIILATLLVLSVATVFFYQNVYVQSIDDIALIGTEDKLSVTLATDVADNKLTVRCTDTHGNSLTAPVENGVATFEGLKPGTAYTLEVQIKGFHKLIGATKRDYTTVNQTIINGFYAATGNENGSVILSFTIQGPDSDQWKVTYEAEGEEIQTVTFTGHMVTLNGLTIGKEYTFTLEPLNVLTVTGSNTVTYVASNIVLAENLQVLGFQDGKLGIAWSVPEGQLYPKWHVRCYNDAGFDMTQTTLDCSIEFEGLEPGVDYIIEVTADGMSLSARINLSANATTISNLKADASNQQGLLLTWESNGTAPAGGWKVQYSIDGSSDQFISCTENSATIPLLIPGATYTITVQTADGGSVLGGNLTFKMPEAEAYNNYLVTADDMEFSMCKTPKKKDWTRKDVPSGDYTTSFKVGTSASFVMHVTKKTTKTDDMVVTLYVIRDAEGNFLSASEESRTWDDMWDDRYGELTIPKMPATAGNYTVEIYFDGALATTQSFIVTD